MAKVLTPWRGGWMFDEPYDVWVSKNEPTANGLALMKERLSGFRSLPTISVLLVVSETDEIWMKASVTSVLKGAYARVELCICDNGSRRPHVGEALEEFAASDERVKVRRLPEPLGFSEAVNETLALATGELVTLLGQGDELAPWALLGVVDLLQDVGADVVYGDEDSVDIVGQRSDPVFKPYWSPDLLLSTAYVGRPWVVRRDLVEELGGFRKGFEGAEEHDLMLRVTEKTDRVYHLPGVLYHRRVYDGELVLQGNGPEGTLRGRASRAALERRGEEAAVEPGASPASVRVVRRLSGRPTVSVVALATGASLADHVLGFQRASPPVRGEVIPANGDGARAANAGAGVAKGEYLLFLRDFRGASSPDFLVGLLREAQRAEAGVVGGRVLGGMRYAGSFFDLSRLTGSPPITTLPQRSPTRFLPVVDLPFNPLAVSVGCMMVRRAVFEDAGGFDEDGLPTSFYDLDLSFRLHQKGLLNVYVPEVAVDCEEFVRALPHAEEIERMWRRWWSMLVKALYYSDSPLRLEEALDRDLLRLVSA